MKIHAATATAVLLASLSALHAPAIAQTGVKKYEAQEIQKAQELRRKKEAFERAEIQRQQNLRKNRAAYEAEELAAQKALEEKKIQYEPFAVRAQRFIYSTMRICDGKLQFFDGHEQNEFTNVTRKMSYDDYEINSTIRFEDISDIDKLNEKISEKAILSFVIKVKDFKNLYQRSNFSGNNWSEWYRPDKYGYQNIDLSINVGSILLEKSEDGAIKFYSVRGKNYPFVNANYVQGQGIDGSKTTEKYFTTFVMDGYIPVNGQRLYDVEQINCLTNNFNLTSMFSWADLLSRRQPNLPATAIVQPQYWINTNDYPPRALQNGEQGSVEFEISISDDGAVESCIIIRSSGSTLLDEATCKAVKRRARFTPATNDQGQPIDSKIKRSFTWRI